MYYNMITKTLHCSELSTKDFSIPSIIKNKILLSPGEWNGSNYSSKEIKKAFDNTDWTNKDVNSLILDHSDKPLSVHDWVGWVKNPRIEENNLVGDLEIYDEPILVKLLQAKAKFGISAKLRGEDDGMDFKDFTFENFSVVVNPACKKAFINLSENAKKSEETPQKIGAEENFGILLKGGKKMEEKKLEEENAEEEKKEEKKEEPVAEVPAVEPAEATESEEKLGEVTLSSEWPAFAQKMREKYPKMPFKELALAFKEERKSYEKIEALTEREIINKISELNDVLKRKQYAAPKTEMTTTEKKLSEQTKELSSQIKELKEKLDEPSAKSVQELSQSKGSPTIFSSEEQHHSAGTLEMANFLQNMKK